MLPENSELEMESPMLQLSPELFRNIASFIDPNDVTFFFKLTCKEVAAALREQYRTIQLRGEPRVLQSPSDQRRWVVATAVQPWPGAAFVAHWGRPEPWRALPRWLRHRLLCLAASSLHSPSLDAALAHCGTVVEVDALASAITAGDLDACRRLYETEGCSWDYELVGTAVGLSGSLPVCEWLAEAIPDSEAGLQRVVLPAAILAGHERVVEWALERTGDDRVWSGAWVGAAAKAGRLELMQRLAARYPWPQRGEPEVLAQLAFGCPLAVLQQYYEPWGMGLLQGIGPKLRLLLAAAGSPTPDWAEKFDWLWARWGAASAAVLGAYIRRVDGALIAPVLQHTDFAERLQLLASRGMGPCLDRQTLWAAGAIGSTAVVDFCLDQLPALLRQQAAAPVAAAGGGGPAAAAAGGPLAAEDLAAQQQQQQQQQINELMEIIARAAIKQDNVAVLRLLRGRGFVFRALHSRFALGEPVPERSNEPSGLAALRYLLLEDPADLALDADDAAGDCWSYLLRDATVKGADLSVLRHLHEQLGAPIDLVAVAQGGSEEALSWAVAALEAAGQAPEPLSCSELQDVLSSGNWAAADWLVRHGLAPPKQELLRHMLLGDTWRARVPDLQWVVGMGKGQDGVQAPAQVQWAAELLEALVQMKPMYTQVSRRHTVPAHTRWLAALIDAAAAEAQGGRASASAGA